jgi:hypothetical protein
MTVDRGTGALLWEAFRDFGDDPQRGPPAGGEALEKYLAELRRESGPKPRRKHRPRAPVPDGLRTMREAAAKLACSIKTLKAHVAAGAIGYVVTGHGSKRPRRMFTDADINAFIANQTRKDSPACPSTATRARRSGNSISNAEVIAFTARRNAGPGAKRKR